MGLRFESGVEVALRIDRVCSRPSGNFGIDSSVPNETGVVVLRVLNVVERVELGNLILARC